MRRSVVPIGFAASVLLMVLWAAVGRQGAAADAFIHPGDKIAVTVFNHPDLSIAEVTVTSAGAVHLPIAGTVVVEGLSESRAAARVQAALDPYLYHPSVDVRVSSQSQSIFFTGSLVGVQPYAPGETLGAALGAFRQAVGAGQGSSAVNGLSVSSIDLRRVRIERAKKTSDYIDLEALSRSGDSGPRMEPGDLVLLTAKPIRVDVRGDIAVPQTVYVYPGDTLAQAVAEAGPMKPATSYNSIGLRRDGVDSIVTSAGDSFTGPAHDGDVVTLRPAPHVSVLGMVEKAGNTTLQNKPTLLNALYEAGGPNRFADLAHVKVSHEGVTRTCDISRLTHGDLSQNVNVADGDVVFVPEGHKIDIGVFGSVVNALATFRVLGL